MVDEYDYTTVIAFCQPYLMLFLVDLYSVVVQKIDKNR